ncbi:6-hydroxymethylpterin diphosphokinase MptE-like protein [Catenovulum sediminis]|uniref:motility associated factor glycosyltransferase family protein n=1 Tax=Catenovulum sediminis TaxID=1740262 RepID=UPI00117C0452|nr:6-hydroxymethylpterin diphosphokinase MptE-like protein [Catenovulum sediminis]
MLKDIRLHIEQDEEKQSEIEAELAADIQRQHSRNIQAFSYHIPSLLSFVQNIRTSNISLFCNRFGQRNIVDYGNGRTLYGLDPKAEIHQQFNAFCRFPQYVALNETLENQSSNIALKKATKLEDLPHYQTYLERSALPKEIDVLVVLGLGMGQHIVELLNSRNIKHLAIYEPELQYFQCSVMAIDWELILDTAKSKGTAIYLQIGKDGRDLLADVSELNQHFPFDGFYLYPHYHHPVFDSLAVSLRDFGWQKCMAQGINYQQQQADNYLPIWTQSIDLTNLASIPDAGMPDTDRKTDGKTDSVFAKNIAAFKKYYPQIAKEFSDYQPNNWLPVVNQEQQINLIEKKSLTSWHGDNPKQECEQNFENFCRYPNKDGLVLGYKGTKLKHYLHYQFVAETEKILEEIEEEAGNLPQDIKSLIVFGVGTGYQLECLFNHHQVENLFICEPNRDFFYASLYSIDWAQYLKQIDESGGRLYLNIGDDGTHLFRDLLNQFYSIGPYILANTYFYQSYYNSNLVAAIAQLREQLQVVISMGEYYDHARYGIAHTTETIARGYPFLIQEADKKLSYQDKEVPIFLVGNGPSLDQSIETIKEWKAQAIIVSCGTALMPLYKNGIVPDFHAEIEQNRSTFDWICRIGDFDYLKQISLISCNGIHPDTCDLFKDVYLAFKEGESSTVSAIEVIGKGLYEELQFAFPTVANFALNIFTKMGFNQVYLFGIDLGFYDKTKHHSTQSGYYKENGEQMYDYEAKNNTSMVVPGNFRPTVFTKHEFKVSKTILEQTLAQRKVDCFNCSDGALIVGSVPLEAELVLLLLDSKYKKDCLLHIRFNAFSNSKCSGYDGKYQHKYSELILKMEIDALLAKSSDSSGIPDVDELIRFHKELLFSSYSRGQSLLFYYLYGTVNYMNSVLLKAMYSSEANVFIGHLLSIWHKYLNKIKKDLDIRYQAYDSSSSFATDREYKLIMHKKNLVDFKVEVLDCTYKSILKRFVEHNFSNSALNCEKVHLAYFGNRTTYNDYTQTFVSDSKTLVGFSNLTFGQDLKTLYYSCNPKDSYFWWLSYDNLQLNDVVTGKVPIASPHRSYFYAKFIHSMDNIFLFLPKYNFVEQEYLNADAVETLNYICNQLEFVKSFVEFFDYIAVPKKGIDTKDCVLDAVGNRGCIIESPIDIEVLIGKSVSLREAKNILDSIN